MRVIAWLLLAAFLILTGLWPPLATVPMGLVVNGATVVLAQVPAALLLAGGYLVLHRRAA